MSDYTTNFVVGITGWGKLYTLKYKGQDNQYQTLGWDEVMGLVDAPQMLDKAQAQWLIPSNDTNYMARSSSQNKGDYACLWADIDKNPPALDDVLAIVGGITGGCDVEIYTSRSARSEFQKSRILIPLSVTLNVDEWVICQSIFNDLLTSAGVIPDRSSEGTVQPCYLPNRGEFYDSRSVRGGWFFNPLEIWCDRIQARAEAIKADQEAAQARIADSKAKRSQRLSKGFNSPVDAFNAAYVVEDILLQAGYDQKGSTFRHPTSESGSYSASIKDGRVHSLSSSDPLYTDGGGIGAHDAFSAFCVLFHRGNHSDAIKDAGDNWLSIGGESWNVIQRKEWAKQQEPQLIVDEVTASPLDLLRSFSVTGQSKIMREKMLNDVFALKDLAILGQWTTFYASPNTGKTLMALWLIVEQIKNGEINGCDVFYVNVDDTYKGGVQKTEIAEEFDFNMLLPDQNGFKKEALLDLMSMLSISGEARGKIILLDTLKKFTNIMDKKEASNFGDRCRGFVASGGTVICLAHVNKKKDDEGKSVFSGTSDIVDDSDCAYVIEKLSSESNGANATTHSIKFENIKARGDVAQSVAFKYKNIVGRGYRDLLDSVERLNEQDIKKAQTEAAIQVGHEKDAGIINSIKDFISGGTYSKTELINKVVEDTAEPLRSVKRVLNRWEGQNFSQGHLWRLSKGEKNLRTYSLVIDPSEKVVVDLFDLGRGVGEKL